MTVIAWDGETMAADRQASIGNYTYAQIQKIFRVEGVGLVGFSGLSSAGIAVIEWLRNGAVREDYPLEDSDECTVMVITQSKKIILFNGPTPVIIEAPFHAIGSGCDFALASMYLGKKAVQAVEVACALDESCGNGIDSLDLWEDVP